MQVEIDEEKIKQLVIKQLEMVVDNTVKAIFRDWQFEEKVKKVVRSMVDEELERIARETIKGVDKLKTVAEEQVIKSLKSKLDRALREMEKAEKVSNELPN